MFMLTVGAMGAVMLVVGYYIGEFSANLKWWTANQTALQAAVTGLEFV